MARPSTPRFPDAATRRRVLRRRRQVAAAAALLVLTALAFGAMVLVSLGDTPPVATVRTLHLPATTAVSRPAPLPWAATGESAVAVPAAGFATQSGPEEPVPVASMTKIMTAYVVLHDHPLRPGRPGPVVTITPADAQNFATDTVTDQANVLLQAGETLTELQMVQGLLVHSANDLAYALANWDAGSVTAFVARMNAAAARLGMSHTHFADASGFDPGSVSTAGDLLKVTAAALRNRVFAHAVTLLAVTLPLAGTVGSYTPMLGTPGVVGVKSGFTTQAGGGDVLAYTATVGGRRLTALAAVTSQEGPTVLQRAGQEALTLARAAAAEVVQATAARVGQAVATATVDGRTVRVVVTRPVVLDVGPGAVVRMAVVVRRAPRGGDPAGTPVGTATFVAGSQRVAVPVRTAAPLPAPPLLQRLF